MSGVVMLRILVAGFLFLFIIAGFSSAHIGPISKEYPLEKPSVNSGHKIYSSNCAGCHGEKGDGSGINHTVDFTNHEFMINENSSVFFSVVTEGISGIVPPFENLSEPERWDTVAYVWTFWADRESALRGKSIFEKSCASCHGMKGDGSALPEAFDFTNLSNTIGNAVPSIYFNSVSNGVLNTAMPPWRATLSENERWDSVKYVWTFQFRDYPVSAQATPQATTPSASPGISPTPEIPSGKEWYNTPVGAAILLISLAMFAGIIYLFIKGVLER